MLVNNFVLTCLTVLSAVRSAVAVRSKVADDFFDDDDIDSDADDFSKSVQGVMDSIFDFLGDKDGCFFKCSNGGSPIPKRHHRPTANGCGSFGIKLDTSHFPAIEKCCDTHDRCYHTCNRDKETCDDEFGACLGKMCKGVKDYVSRDVYEGCKSMADLMYAGTMALGCKPYKESQEDACVCSNKSQMEL